MSMRALSDFLPSLSARAGRDLWISQDVLADVQAATSSLRTAYDGEALLEASSSRILIHIGPGGAARALNYVHGRQGGRAILFHPGTEVRNTEATMWAGHPSIRVVNSLNELPVPAGAAVNVFIDESCFDLDLVNTIATQVDIDWLIGAFESARYPTLSIYKHLQKAARHFRLRDVTINSLLHGGPRDTLDVSVISGVRAGSIAQYDHALAGKWTLSGQVQLIPDALGPAELKAFEHLAARFSEVTLVESSIGLVEAFRTAFASARGRYIALISPGRVPDEAQIGKLFSAALAANADMVLATPEPVLANQQLLLGTQRLGSHEIPDAIAKTSAALFRTDFLNFYDLAFDPRGGEAALAALAGSAAMLNAQIIRLHMPSPLLPALTSSEHQWLATELTAPAERMGRAADRKLAAALLMSIVALRHP
jgi:hypothetical protein